MLRLSPNQIRAYAKLLSEEEVDAALRKACAQAEAEQQQAFDVAHAAAAAAAANGAPQTAAAAAAAAAAVRKPRHRKGKAQKKRDGPPQRRDPLRLDGLVGLAANDDNPLVLPIASHMTVGDLVLAARAAIVTRHGQVTANKFLEWHEEHTRTQRTAGGVCQLLSNSRPRALHAEHAEPRASR